VKRALARLGPVATGEMLLRAVNPAIPRLYDRATLYPAGAPVQIDHDEDQVVGRVREISLVSPAMERAAGREGSAPPRPRVRRRAGRPQPRREKRQLRPDPPSQLEPELQVR
jgi:hypothetical protein